MTTTAWGGLVNTDDGLVFRAKAIVACKTALWSKATSRPKVPLEPGSYILA